MCIPNTPKTSSMEVDDTIPTNFNKQDQGHGLLSVEISHRSRSSSLKYMLSLYNSKNIYKQTSVCSPKPNWALLPQLGISENSSVGEKKSSCSMKNFEASL